jgi:hypothetical protein
MYFACSKGAVMKEDNLVHWLSYVMNIDASRPITVQDNLELFTEVIVSYLDNCEQLLQSLQLACNIMMYSNIYPLLNVVKLFMQFTSTCLLKLFANLRMAYPRAKHVVLLNQTEFSRVCTDADFVYYITIFIFALRLGSPCIHVNTTSLARPIGVSIYKFSTLQTCLQSTHNSSWEIDLFLGSTTLTSKGMPLWLLEAQRACGGLRWYWRFARKCTYLRRSVASPFARPVTIIAR